MYSKRMKLFHLLVLCLESMDLVHSQVSIFPASYNSTNTVEVNGSSATGHCRHFTNYSNGNTSCRNPTTSVLFDGHIPTLTGLDGDMWASQLLTLQPTGKNAVITFDFSNHPNFRLERLEVVMFNCPERGTAVQTIRLEDSILEAGYIGPTITSCHSLVRVHIPAITFATRISLRFVPRPGSEWVHLAELIFLGNCTTCPQDTAITTPTLPMATQGITPSPPDTTLLDTGDTSSPAITVCEVCPSCSTPTILASIITAILTTLLATVITVLVLIAVCKCRPKSTPGGSTSAGGEEQEYEQVDKGEAVSDPTYMEVGAAGGGGNTFELKQNEAYATHKK